MKTHHQTTKAAMRSLFRMLEAIEADPSRAAELSKHRHMVAYRITNHGDPEPIDHRALCSLLVEPHPLASGDPNDRVGDFDLYDHFTATGKPVAGYAGSRVRKDGSVEFIEPNGTVSQPYSRGPSLDVEPLRAESDRLGNITLGVG